MGLDMYLYKKHYVKNWAHDKDEGKYKITIEKGGKKDPKINTKDVIYIVEEVGYWRKANAIHKWFIDNCANGNEEKTEMYVSYKKLEDLRDIVSRVLASCKLVKGEVVNGQSYDKTMGEWVDNKVAGKYVKDPSLAQMLLPTTSGFFFGSTEYDQWYVEDLKLTLEILEEALTDESAEFEYSASW